INSALSAQSGTWWYNFQTLGGTQHSHIRSLTHILNAPQTLDMLRDADIYITGHSLGGYLAYVATYELVNMGFADNIKRVAAFSAPLFSAETVDLVASLPLATRQKMIHYYVPGDLVAGFIGVELGSEPPAFGAFALMHQLFSTMRDVRGIDVPQALYTLSQLMVSVEERIAIALPAHIVELIWRLGGAMSADALAITNDFQRVIRHVPVAHTWHSPRTYGYSPIPEDATILDIIRNYTPELMAEIVEDMVLRMFDVDTHFMMNFYPYLGAE
ncbi:MAG: DUF2974 domain-containing protein, partial [Defluviitaleaceae bacterium]|nr:DUF2974 domain-containing protein [Defluviitaleaceae bacterium]